ncbi:MAG: hypothetical protein QOJ72_2485 [Nocardioidaceae bacterium]|nr:hypothetical protein [Nocardioidaceae bacterium]
MPVPSSQAAMWSMVIGIAAIPIGICAGKWGLAPFLLGGTAMVLGIVALGRIRHSQGRQKGRPQAWLGIVLGTLMCLVGIVIALLTVVTDFFVWIAQIL